MKTGCMGVIVRTRYTVTEKAQCALACAAAQLSSAQLSAQREKKGACQHTVTYLRPGQVLSTSQAVFAAMGCMRAERSRCKLSGSACLAHDVNILKQGLRAAGGRAGAERPHRGLPCGGWGPRAQRRRRAALCAGAAAGARAHLSPAAAPGAHHFWLQGSDAGSGLSQLPVQALCTEVDYSEPEPVQALCT